MTITDSRSLTRDLGRIVTTRVGRLQSGYLRNASGDVAALARLRRGLGKQPGDVLEILEHTTAPELVRDWRDDEPTFAEIALHHCMTLFALHQQSQSRPMHRTGPTIGRAARRLVDGEVRPENPIVRRFAMLGTADTLAEVVHHLRGLVQLLRANRVPLDYGRLARDLLHWQYQGGPARVRLSWGRDFYTSTITEDKQPSTTKDQQ